MMRSQKALGRIILWVMATGWIMPLAQAANPGNGVTVTEASGSSQTDRPLTLSRVFAQGDIPNFAKARVGGLAVPTQCDVKTRWPDGSVQHAIISFQVTLPALGQVEVDFINQAGGNNGGALTQNEMLAADYDFGAEIQISNGSLTETARARTLLDDGAYSYWLQGPMVTQIILEDRSPARAYDLGFDEDKPFHPIFVATFYPGWSGVRVEYIGENMWTTHMKDMDYALTLIAGENNPAIQYTKASLTHFGRTRWRKTFWIGQEPGTVNIDHNFPYMIYSRVVPSYDLTKVVSDSAIQSEIDSFNNRDTDINGNGQYNKSFGTTGGRPEIGLLPRWSVRYLYTFDPGLQDVVLGNGEVSGHVPVHYRESDPNKLFDDLDTVDAFGRSLSVDARPTVESDLGRGRVAPEDIMTYPGPISNNDWQVDLAHQGSFVYLPYLVTGDWYFLEEIYSWAAYNVASGNPNTLHWGRHADWGRISDQVRGEAWGLRNVAHAAFLAPDGSAEQKYFTQKLNNSLAAYEGEHNITDGAFYDPTPGSKWEWGRSVHAVFGPNPLHLMYEGSTSNKVLIGLDTSVVGAGGSPWMFNFWYICLGHMNELGFASGKLLETVSKNLLNQILHPDYNPFLVDNYHIGIRGLDLLFMTTWAEVKAGHEVSSDSSFGATYAYSYNKIAKGAASFLVGNSDGNLSGDTAYAWMKANIPDQSQNDDPTWAFVPRSPVTLPPPGNTPPAAPEGFLFR